MDIIIFHFGLFFPFYPTKTRNMKISTKMRKTLEISPFYTSVPKIMIMIICYTVPEKWHVTHVIFIFDFWLFFALLPPNSPKNQNFEKIKKLPGDIIILHVCTKNHNHKTQTLKIVIICNTVPEIWHVTDVIVTFHFELFFPLLPL